MTTINSEVILISGSIDTFMKAWKFNGSSLNCALTQPVQAPITCMELTSPTFLVMGLGDGRFCGWNLATNSFDYIIAH